MILYGLVPLNQHLLNMFFQVKKPKDQAQRQAEAREMYVMYASVFFSFGVYDQVFGFLDE